MVRSGNCVVLTLQQDVYIVAMSIFHNALSDVSACSIYKSRGTRNNLQVGIFVGSLLVFDGYKPNLSLGEATLHEKGEKVCFVEIYELLSACR